MIIPALFMILFCALVAAFLTLKVYGVVLCFKRKWYIGVASLVVPLFPEIVGATKFFFKKDLLK